MSYALSKQKKFLVAVLVVTYRRPEEIQRLLISLRKCSSNISLVSVCDNFGEDERTRIIIEEENVLANYPILYKKSDINIFAAGLNQALAQAIKYAQEGFTHYLICDDDVAFDTDILSGLLAALEKAGAASAAPALTDHSGLVIATPLLNRADGKLNKTNISPEAFREQFSIGYTPRLTVCMGTCHLVTAKAMEKAGSYREDFWLMGDDLDFSHRIAAQQGGSIFVPWITVAHLYGAPFDPLSAERSNYLKKMALLHNYTYMGYHTPYGKYIRGRYFDLLRGKGLMPQYLAFLKEYRWRKEAVIDLLTTIFAAWIMKQPAGGAIASRLRTRRATLQMK
jgi:hypothetical protein